MAGYPEPGSLQESLLISVHHRRQKAAYLATLLNVAAQRADESKVKALIQEYQDTCFPWLAEVRTKEIDTTKELFDWFSKQGPINFTVPTKEVDRAHRSSGRT